jgi:hypothetical protein
MQRLAEGTQTTSFCGLQGSECTEMDSTSHSQSTEGLEVSLFPKHHTPTDYIFRSQ